MAGAGPCQRLPASKPWTHLSLTPPGGPTSQSVGVLPVAQVVDEGTQSLLVTDMFRHHHLLLDDVRLWEVGPSLRSGGRE